MKIKNARLVAWGLSMSLTLTYLAYFLDFSEDFYVLAGIGIVVFGIWASNLLFKIKK
jgi:hypothetical protein